MRQPLRTCSTKRCRSSAPPMADPPPVGGHTGATTEPTTSPIPNTLSDSRARSSSLASMLTCGSNRNRSTPSNFAPFAFAAAVRRSMLSRSMGGSESGPFPTRPGHMALCTRGNSEFMTRPSYHVVGRAPLIAHTQIVLPPLRGFFRFAPCLVQLNDRYAGAIQVILVGDCDPFPSRHHPLIAFEQQRFRFGVFLLSSQAGSQQALGAESLPVVRLVLAIELKGLAREGLALG